MDELSQLALMAKAKLVFETQDTYLSFPALTPISYTADQLKFNNLANLNVMSEFARFANSVPKGTLFQADQQVYLWDVYADLFTRAELAKGTLTPQDEEKYRQALAVLYTAGPGGQTDSPTLLTYKEYRDAYINATEVYKNAQLNADFSTSAEEKKQWQTVDEPRLRQNVDKANADWIAKGSKMQVEDAQRIELATAAKSPIIKWQDWSHSFNRDLDMMTDANSQSFAITGFSPSDTFDYGDWPTFKLSGTDVKQLIDQAPQELKNVFGSNIGISNIDSISFEFRSVGLNRPWLRSAIFDARFWRLPESEPPVSDGNTPALGQCPAYITGLVFARHMVVTMKGATPTPVKSLPTLTLTNIAAKQALLTNMSNRVMVTRTPMMSTVQNAAPQIAASRLMASGFTRSQATVAIPGLRAQSMAAEAAVSPAIRMRPVMTAPTRIEPTQPAPPAPPPPPPQAAVSNDISILAFICKRLKKCPNPDPAFSW